MCTVLVQAWINMNLWIAHSCKNDFYNVPGTCIWDLIPVLSQKDVQVQIEDKIWEYTRNDWNHIPCTGIQFRNCRSLVKVYILLNDSKIEFFVAILGGMKFHSEELINKNFFHCSYLFTCTFILHFLPASLRLLSN